METDHVETFQNCVTDYWNYAHKYSSSETDLDIELIEKFILCDLTVNWLSIMIKSLIYI